MAALHQHEEFKQTRETAHLETTHLEDRGAEDVPELNENDLGDDPKREAQEAAMSYTKEEEGEALKKLDWNLIPL